MYIRANKQSVPVLEQGVDLFVAYLTDLHAVHDGKDYVSVAMVTTERVAEPTELQNAFSVHAATLKRTGTAFFVVGIVHPNARTTTYCLMAEGPIK